MQRHLIWEKIEEAKESKKLSWEEIARQTGISAVFLVAVCMGKATAEKEQADRICALLGLGPEISDQLQKCVDRSWDKQVPNDPVLYRFYEAFGVYGEAVRELIWEKFGDGIMSAVDMVISLERVDTASGPRVRIVMDGKFLPYRKG
ncbi:cyanase [Methylacidiphilum caldifontis]|uniref:Cyanate hydratase n=1 Tax=Methylacidiphilum caldifontis TaxID=2795386 RepID=A0A4Y8PIN9_9BACT|nr:cyanase [Methylacidiphilum caldifontis]TFE71074.1 cyanase [Methylacidiphilum caldifontis]